MTKSSKHTPGPWRTSREDMDSFVGDRPVVYVYRDGEERIPVLGDDGGGHDQQRADARLIAAAPEMLDVLRRFVAPFRVAGTSHLGATQAAVVHDALAVIAKAERGSR